VPARSDVDVARRQRVGLDEQPARLDSSPISVVKIRSAPMASSICTLSSRRTAGSIVVSQSCSGFISPRPL